MEIRNLSNPVIREDMEQILGRDLPWEEFRNRTVLVTGASGMIPSYAVYTFLALNDAKDMNVRVLALVRNEEKAKRIFGSVLEREDIQLIAQDVCDPIEVDGPVDYIIHGASAARPSEHKKAPTATIRANLMGTFNLLDLAVEKKASAFVLMSSSEVYGTVPEGITQISETDYGALDILNPRSCYSEGKRGAETICAAYQAQYGIKCRIPRFAHIYGPGLALDDGRVQADFAANVFRGQDIVLKSDGSSQRAYTYVGDAVAGMFYVLLKGPDMAYNVADSRHIISIRQLAESFVAARPEKNLQLRFDIPEGQSGMYNPAAFIGLSGEKLEGLGWEPENDIRTGCDKMLCHYEFTENAR